MTGDDKSTIKTRFIKRQSKLILDALNPRCEDCYYYRVFKGGMMCHFMAPFLADKKTQRLRPSAGTMNCGTEGRNFKPNKTGG
jgi:hypothetical protein